MFNAIALAVVILSSCDSDISQSSPSRADIECQRFTKELKLMEQGGLSIEQQRYLTAEITTSQCGDYILDSFKRAALMKPDDLHRQQLYIQALFYAEDYTSVVRWVDELNGAKSTVDRNLHTSSDRNFVRGVFYHCKGLALLKININDNNPVLMDADFMEDLFRPAIDSYDSVGFGIEEDYDRLLSATRWRLHPSIEARIGIVLLARQVGALEWATNYENEARGLCLSMYNPSNCDNLFREEFKLRQEQKKWFPAVDLPLRTVRVN